MAEKKHKDALISDSGIIESNKTKQSIRFVALCDVLAVALIVLGVVAFVKGYF
ncbi:hypothetical protein SAMN02910298_01428 [Pseudobutyrivibrio sp. YE44]|uniref:hypothetical protein n=1 Tax=Pseudobutyrivibrio sp. YE44 TaxID=1520802 RepID=UPI00088D97D6|nr:hypothetical protein [Pseudobutyrivibrio sp. YE44]SDB29270.1 hypothetical protein SAMN02910298_01428 [Pseudobutyrivibrio sp. YE44]